jgi:hypothetical protein
MRQRRSPIACLILAGSLVLAVNSFADGPADNVADSVRPIPPPGNELAPGDRQELEAGVAKLGSEIDSLHRELKDDPKRLAYLPDVQIFHNAVRYPLAYHEACDVKRARKAIEDGMARAKLLREGKTPWTTSPGPRGYVSKIDDSVQPYVLAVPTTYNTSRQYRLDLSCHGRDEGLTELKFISAPPPAANSGKFVVNLYGRYCNANKFAGEIDCLEVLDALRAQYPIDENRILMTGFSMGGAACWQFAVHYTDLWAAASPGAGFAETRRFLKFFQHEDVNPPNYEKSLWHWYDCTDYAANLANLPTIAYVGELDSQKQASDVMAEAMRAEGMKLDLIIGPKTGHTYEPGAKRELDRRLDEILARGRDPMPKKIRFTTWTLRYNRMFWVTVDGLEQHWNRARVEAEINPDGSVTLTTENVSALTLSSPRHAPVQIDGTSQAADAKHFVKSDGKWTAADKEPTGLRKRHGLQGPIDDAFLEHFIIVRPTGKPANAKVGAWCSAELDHAIDHWRKQFRGEAIVKDDTDVADADVASSNLVCFGDPSSNKLIARIAGRLPVNWDAQTISLAGKTFPADHHAVAMIYPNPLNPGRYVVLNSGFTFREYDYLNNARQVPKLPDYAVFDVETSRTPRGPGSAVLAGFFDENWSSQK